MNYAKRAKLSVLKHVHGELGRPGGNVPPEPRPDGDKLDRPRVEDSSQNPAHPRKSGKAGARPVS
jgi:hypothetical protein